MAVIKLQGEAEKRQQVYYEVDTDIPPIGVGGMGQVYKGTCVNQQTGVTRPVAIKFMYADLPPHAVERARREASIRLRNDNLIEMLGFIETEEQGALGEITRHYHVVSELLTGVALSDLLEGKTKDRNGEDVPFAVKMLQDYKNDPEHFARTIVMGVLSGLMSLHDAGYIHRDIDPSNIMLTSDGHVKLIDFGIAKQMNNLTTNDKGLTVAGAFMGKPEYASPELALGDIKHQNQTTDIYAVGILLYQCIVGHTPFEGARHNILENQIKGKMPLNVIKDKGLRKIIATACEKRQELRYQSSAQMRVALEALTGNTRAMSNKQKYGIAGGIAAVLIAVLLTAYAIRTKQDKAEAEQAKAEQALLEQKRQAELKDKVDAIIEQSTLSMNKGKNIDTDDFELHLMQSYEILLSADSIVGINAQYANLLATKKQEGAEQLNEAMKQLRGKAEDSKGISDEDGQAFYEGRADSVQHFINKYIQ